ncbi:hypothetical protein [Gorillibacterium sp. CAU 1737]|uniref:hypothetical protein n=1 Tax=Gorillibacterium sp. CAU 1737 TaxID=3140362 RepID=UPI00326015F9
MIILVILLYGLLALEPIHLYRRGWKRDFGVNVVLYGIGLIVVSLLIAGVAIPSPTLGIKLVVDWVLGRS